MAKKPSSSFQSMQILSEKAQTLWAKAKKTIEESRKHETKKRKSDCSECVQKDSIYFDVRAFTIVKIALMTLVIVAAAWLIFVLRDKLFLFFLSLFISIIIDNGVRFLEAWKVPRPIAVLLLYILFIAVAGFLVISLIPIVAAQIQDMARYINHSLDAFLLNPKIEVPAFSTTMNTTLTEIVQKVLESMGIKDRTTAFLHFGQDLSTVAQTWVGLAVQIAGSVVNFIINFTLVLVFAFFIQLEREKISDFLRSMCPGEYRAYFDSKADAIYAKMTQWFNGQLLLCVSIGLLVFVALVILDMPYAQTLGLLAAFTEFIPYAGPLIAAFPAIIIALSQKGFFWMLVVAAIYYLIQWCENNILVPLIMKHAVGLSPISIMFGMLVGISFPDTIHPIIGIIIAVPVTAILTIFIQDVYLLQKRK
jgi:predicted PurR-regulated permease PerM